MSGVNALARGLSAGLPFVGTDARMKDALRLVNAADDLERNQLSDESAGPVLSLSDELQGSGRLTGDRAKDTPVLLRELRARGLSQLAAAERTRALDEAQFPRSKEEQRKFSETTGVLDAAQLAVRKAVSATVEGALPLAKVMTVGTVTKNPYLAAGAMGLTMGADAYQQSKLNLLREEAAKRGIEPDDLEGWRKLLGDEELAKDIETRSVVRGGVAGVVGAALPATGKLAGLTEGFVAGAAPSAARGIAAQGAGLVADAVAQGAVGAGGETVSQLATDGRIVNPEAIVESAAVQAAQGVGFRAVGGMGDEVRAARERSANSEALRMEGERMAGVPDEPSGFDPTKPFEVVSEAEAPAATKTVVPSERFAADAGGVDMPPLDEPTPTLGRRGFSADAGGLDFTPADRPQVFADTRGYGDIFHGASSPIRGDLVGQGGSDKNIYGSGFYTTDAVDIAHGYTKKGGRGEPSLYHIQPKRPLKLYDLDAPMPGDISEFVHGIADGSGLMDEVLSAKPKTLREVYDAMRHESPLFDMSTNDVQDIFDEISAHLEGRGFDGITHKGGNFTGKRPHQVRIFFNPAEVLDHKLTDAKRWSYEAPEPAPGPRMTEAPAAGVFGADAVGMDFPVNDAPIARESRSGFIADAGGFESPARIELTAAGEAREVAGAPARTMPLAAQRAEVSELSVSEPTPYVPPEVFETDPKLPIGARIHRAVRKGKGSLVGFLSSKFTKEGAMPESAFLAKEAASGRMNEAALRAQHASEDLARAMSEANGGRKKFTAEELRPVNAALAGDRAALASLPEGVRGGVEQMRAMIDGLSARMIEEGVLPEKMEATVDGNMGAYLHRSYRLFDDKGWAKSVPEAAKRRVMGVFAERFPEMTPEQQRGAVENLLQRNDGPVAELAKLGRRNTNILMERGDIHPAIRALWGEYTDPFVNFTKSVQKMSSLIENAKLQREYEAMGKGVWLFDTPQGDHFAQVGGAERGAWKSLEDARRAADNIDPQADPAAPKAETGAELTKSLGPLAKYYTTPEIAATLRNLDGAVAESNVITRALLKASGIVQFNQTVLSPTTHIRNFTGNLAIMAANGRIGTTGLIDGVRALGDAVKTNEGAREAMARYTRLGLVGEGLTTGVLKETVARSKALEAGGDSAVMGGLRKVFDKTVKLYGAEDDFFKIVAFEQERKLLGKAYPEAPAEWLDQAAANRVKNTLPTFSRASKIVKYLRRQPFVGNFIAWPSELLRTSVGTVDLALKDMRSGNAVLARDGAKRLASFIAVAGVAPIAAEQASAALVGWSKDKTEALRELLPEFMRSTPVVWLGQDKNGLVRVMSQEGVNPYSMFHKPLQELLRNKFERDESDAGVARVADAMASAMASAMAPWAGEKILYSKVADLGRNKDALTGRPIWNDTDSYTDKVGKALGHVGVVFLPGAANTAQRLYKGANGVVEDSGRAYSFADEAKAAGLGQRVTSVDINRAVMGRLRGFNAREAASGEAMRGAVNAFKNNSTAATPERFVKDWEETQERRFREYQSMRKVLRAAEVLGVDKGAVARAAKEGGLGTTELAAVWAGKFMPSLPAREDMAMLMSKPGGAAAIEGVKARWGAWMARDLKDRAPENP